MLSVILYTEINLFCILLLLIIIYKILRNINKNNEQKLYAWATLSLVLFFALDLLWGLIENGNIFASRDANYLVNVFYFIFSGIASYLWFVFSETLQNSRTFKNKILFCISLIPLVVIILFSILSVKTGWFFYIDDLNKYHRGNLHLLQMVLSYGYICFTCVKALILGYKKENYAKKNQYLTLASFVIPPFIAAIIQEFVPGTPIICIGITISVFLVYINMQEMRIAIDPLTNINNRNQMITYLSSKIKHYDNKTYLYLLILDVDNFKEINDYYGHIEGDVALIKVSDVLKVISEEFNCFISRYGGDEFIVIYETAEKDSIEDLCTKIKETLKIEDEKLEYALSVTIGYALYNKDIEFIPDFIEEADKKLYMNKKTKDSIILEKKV